MKPSALELPAGLLRLILQHARGDVGQRDPLDRAVAPKTSEA
jgi:hypothetical protein